MPTDDKTVTVEDAETTTETGATTDVDTDYGDAGNTDDAATETETVDPNAGLKSALAKERLERKNAEKRIKEFEAERDAATKTPAENELDNARREAAAEATSKANARIVRSEVKFLAGDKFANPALALKLLDLDAFELDDEGEIDADAVNKALTALLTENPGLGKAKARFQTDIAQGAKASAAPGQLTRDELAKLSPADRLKAASEGRVKTLIGQ